LGLTSPRSILLSIPLTLLPREPDPGLHRPAHRFPGPVAPRFVGVPRAADRDAPFAVRALRSACAMPPAAVAARLLVCGCADLNQRSCWHSRPRPFPPV